MPRHSVIIHKNLIILICFVQWRAICSVYNKILKQIKPIAAFLISQIFTRAATLLAGTSEISKITFLYIFSTCTWNLSDSILVLMVTVFQYVQWYIIYTHNYRETAGVNRTLLSAILQKSNLQIGKYFVQSKAKCLQWAEQQHVDLVLYNIPPNNIPTLDALVRMDRARDRWRYRIGFQCAIC